MKLAFLAFLIPAACSFQTPLVDHHALLALKMTGGSKDAKDEAKDTKVTPEKVAGRKKRVSTVYKIMVAEQAIVGGMLYKTSGVPFYSVGPLLASGVSFILIGAANSNRLTSDTYKRLNLALIQYGLLGFISGIFMGQKPLWFISCFITVVNSVKGYGYGLKGWELGNASLKDDIMSGLKANLKSMTKIPNLKSAGYLAATLTVGTLQLAKIAELFNIVTTGGGKFLFGTRLFRFIKLMLLNVIVFSLKDAADRDRLEGTTFIQLNALSSISFAFWALYEKVATPLGGALCFFSVFSAMNGVYSIIKKNTKS
mmetsp:Transcript_8325/g.10917  ORF Transcript_8325/g.10917 Transcript_8325/m.10917 type:complete len:312 (-) Transcript_8325:325-1260(-)|eukprot:CAMPEP_0198142958 /NCGR_PEP_ID=MMETSP1443-20131203/5607_1 /TAXON_ID=186043 /ORGANISM="Entomoneis sp., Strain CCMP2396" /LENGTH=311 /DNA_ID=CAMNT_0043806091 /DNA_START=112 /DNA_END=1047 /DNA_ORIENTATION=+